MSVCFYFTSDDFYSIKKDENAYYISCETVPSYMNRYDDDLYTIKTTKEGVLHYIKEALNETMCYIFKDGVQYKFDKNDFEGIEKFVVKYL